MGFSDQAQIPRGCLRLSAYADFWEPYKRGLLAQETCNYVPSILSIIVISKNQKLCGFNAKPDPPLNFETFELPAQTDLRVVADLIGVPYEVVQDLNRELATRNIAGRSTLRDQASEGDEEAVRGRIRGTA